RSRTVHRCGVRRASIEAGRHRRVPGRRRAALRDAGPMIYAFHRIVAAMASARRLLSFVGMTSVSLVVAHNLVFLLAYGAGFDEALAHTGHDGTWGTAVAVVLTGAFVLVGLGTWRLHRLGVVARAR